MQDYGALPFSVKTNVIYKHYMHILLNVTFKSSLMLFYLIHFFK